MHYKSTRSNHTGIGNKNYNLCKRLEFKQTFIKLHLMPLGLVGQVTKGYNSVMARLIACGENQLLSYLEGNYI